ncbi:MAG: CHAT domain-containing protein [Fischerella sp. CENA71]|nr:CHAT domain-containing protein [Fischerella sp. CENA71]
MLSDEQRRRLQEEKKSFEQSYKLQSEKIARLRNALVIETDPLRKFQYEQQIQQEENELIKLTDRLTQIEKHLQSAQSIPTISELKNTQQKVLILAAIPHGLRLDKEIREIEEAIRRATNRDLFEIKVRTAVRPQDIRRAIAEEQPQIVHFCGHGEKDGSLLLEDDGGKNKPVAPEGLASLFKLHVDYVRCVLLNACYSEKPAVAISQYIDYVIGMNNPIQDSAAIEFAKGFYDGLGYKNSGNQDVFQRAFDEAMVAIEMENLSQGEIPVLKKKF